MKMKAKEYLKQHPEKYYMVTRELGKPIYIAPQGIQGCNITDKEAEAEQWDSLSNTETRLKFFKGLTGYTQLQYELVK
jgi:hypothetical protein